VPSLAATADAPAVPVRSSDATLIAPVGGAAAEPSVSLMCSSTRRLRSRACWLRRGSSGWVSPSGTTSRRSGSTPSAIRRARRLAARAAESVQPSRSSSEA
jgi:hypothetical protein